MDAIFEAYLAAQRRRRSSPLTIKATTHALRATQRWLDEHEIAPSELTLLQCEEYFDELLDQGAVSTVRRHLAYVRAAYRYGVRHDLVERDPTADVRLPWLPDIEPATYSTDELKTIHAAVRCEREEVAFFLFAFAAGKAWPLVQASVGAVDVVLVRNTRGVRVGCLPLYFGYNADGTTVRVSEMVPCSNSYRERTKPG